MEKAPHILFVDDEKQLQTLFERLFSREGMKVTSCSNAEQAITALDRDDFDLVVTDFMMPEMDGLELLAYIRQEYPDMAVVMITAHANVQHAVRSMKTGAVDYIPKPFSTTELLERVKRLLANRQGENGEARPAAKSRPSRRKTRPVEFIGEHESMKRLKEELIPRLSKSKAPVFVQGESGTGKEIIARLIHQASDRSGKPYIALNCANLPRELVESHLFGHRKGAFTGAVEDMTGAFEMAEGGTLLLDEITEIALPVQAKLLRVLQESEIMKVGTSEPKRVDVRVIATSNRRVADAISEGVFRDDLYHRLAVFPLTVPPLDERRSDIPLLARHFADKYRRLYNLPKKKLSRELLKRLEAQSWPGNVRQLENLIQRGVVMSADRDEIEPSDVFDEFFVHEEMRSSVVPAEAEPATIGEMEKQLIMKTLAKTGNNQQEAAAILGISARTIRNKLKKYRAEGAGESEEENVSRP